LGALKTLLAWLARLFHILLCLALAALGTFGLATGPDRLHLEMFSWTGATLAYIALFGGLFGLLTAILAARNQVRFLFFLWSLAIAAWLTKSLIFSAYRFVPGGWKPAAYLVAAAWVAVIGAFFQMRAKPSPGPRKYRIK
jgi:hypothetical protein